MRPWLRWEALLLTLVCMLGACTGDGDSTAQSTTPTSTKSTISGLESCMTPSTFGVGGAKNQIQGTSGDASLWGLALGPGHVPPRTGDELKIVWRMTGTSPLRVTLSASDGSVQPLVFGPEPQNGSSFDRPGDEWGTGFRFDMAGCWHIRLARTDTSGDVWLDVAA
jgi:hypothetical protein